MYIHIYSIGIIYMYIILHEYYKLYEIMDT